jgi:hypothetical protein
MADVRNKFNAHFQALFEVGLKAVDLETLKQFTKET